jgi:hypothetical protein
MLHPLSHRIFAQRENEPKGTIAMLSALHARRQEHADFCAAAMSSGRYDLIVDQYRYPFTIYLHGTPHILQSERDAWAFYQTVHSAMRSEGFDRLTARVTAEDLPRSGRSRVWTDWVGQGQGKSRVILSTINYCSVVAGRRMTDMIEFTRMTLPDMAA